MIHSKKALLICGLLLISIFAFLIYERNRYNVVSQVELATIREKLKVLSPQEKCDLSFFIDHVTSCDQYPYTLTGYKPMSISNVVIEVTEDLAFFRESFKRPNNQKLRRGYLVWKKYQFLFPRKKYILIDYYFLGKGKKEIALICPKLCMDIIQENIEKFQEILGRPYTNEEVFWILTHPEHDDFYTLIDSTRLLGYLLGFGKNNANLYEQHRGTASRCISRPESSLQDPLQMFSNAWPWPGIKRSPDFACDPTTEETQNLKKHYNKASKTIFWTYFFRNNLEVTLALLIQN